MNRDPEILDHSDILTDFAWKLREESLEREREKERENKMAQRTVQVKKEELLKALLENKKTHAEAYEEAAKKWASDMTAAAEALSKDPTQDKLIAELTACYRNKPVEYISDYDNAIKQMEMEQRDLIELEQSEFNQLVCDHWDWSRNFAANVYTSASIRKK